MNTAAKGRAREHRSMRIFEASGYQCIRAAASKGVFDFVAIGAKDIALVQVKSRDWPSVVEMEQLRDFAVPPGVRKLVHRWRQNARLPDVREVVGGLYVPASDRVF